jgi:hypothetical protein
MLKIASDENPLKIANIILITITDSFVAAINWDD